MITVELAFGLPDKQLLMELEVPEGSTISNVIAASGIAERFPSIDFGSLKKGVWNEIRPDDHTVSGGDRIEIYRPLSLDPKSARRERAAAALAGEEKSQKPDE